MVTECRKQAQTTNETIKLAEINMAFKFILNLIDFKITQLNVDTKF